jgi:hypothetical protein
MVAFGEWSFGEWSPPEIGRSEIGRSEIGHSEIGRSEIGRSENGRSEIGRCTQFSLANADLTSVKNKFMLNFYINYSAPFPYQPLYMPFAVRCMHIPTVHR